MGVLDFVSSVMRVVGGVSSCRCFVFLLCTQLLF